MMHLTAYSVAWFLPCLHLTSLSQVSLHCLGVRVGNCFGRLTEVLAIMALWGCCPHWVFTVGTSTKQNKDKGSRIRTALPTRVDLGSVLTAGQDDPPLDMMGLSYAVHTAIIPFPLRPASVCISGDNILPLLRPRFTQSERNPTRI